MVTVRVRGFVLLGMALLLALSTYGLRSRQLQEYLYPAVLVAMAAVLAAGGRRTALPALAAWIFVLAGYLREVWRQDRTAYLMIVASVLIFGLATGLHIWIWIRQQLRVNSDRLGSS
jgi:hypothetical protein